VLVGHAGKGGCQHDNGEANQANFRQMQGEGGNQPHADDTLGAGYPVRPDDLPAAGKISSVRLRRAAANTGAQGIAGVPAGGFGDNQVLRFADHGHHAAEGGTDAGVHHQAA
jgi:hypothetical protein